MGNISGSEPSYDFNPVPEPVRKLGTQLYLNRFVGAKPYFRCEQYGRTWKVLGSGGDEAADRYVESGQHSEATARGQAER